MKYVSLAKSRAGWQPDDESKKKSAEKPAPKTSADPATSNTNPDGGTSVSKPERG